MPTIIPNWHPIFVHFTVALLSLAVGLFVISSFVKSPLKEQWRLVARWNLWFGAGFTILTGLTGWYAYNTVAHDTPSHGAMTEHRNWAIVTIALILILALWSIVRARRGKMPGALFIGAMAVTGGILASTAWHGGEVVYRYGLGVMSLPKTDAHEHGGVAHARAEAGVAVPDEESAHQAEGGHADGEGAPLPAEALGETGTKRNDAHAQEEGAAAESEIRDDNHDRPHGH